MLARALLLLAFIACQDAGTSETEETRGPTTAAIAPKGVQTRAPNNAAETADVAAGQKDETETQRFLREVPRRTKIGRIRGLKLVSDVVFTSAPQNPHELTFTAAFPSRSKLVLSNSVGRTERFQLGQAHFGRDLYPDATLEERKSRVLTGADSLELQLDLALRRATFLWPDEGGFVGEGSTRNAKVGEFGDLIATLDSETGRPTRMSALNESGEVTGTLQNITWFESVNRWWPKSFEYALSDGVLWKEEVRTVEDGWLFNDVSFLPSDRVDALMGSEIAESIRLRGQPAAFVRRSETSKPLSLQTAVEQAETMWLAEATEDMSSSGALIVVLDERQEPVAIEVEVDAAEGGKQRDGWTLREGQSVWMHLLSDEDQDLGEATESLLEVAARSKAAAGASTPAIIRLRIAIERSPEGDLVRGESALVTSAVTTGLGPQPR